LLSKIKCAADRDRRDHFGREPYPFSEGAAAAVASTPRRVPARSRAPA